MRERWSISKLSEETLIDRRTVAKVLSNTISGDEDGRYYISEFIEAFRSYIKGKTGAGDLEAEKTRLTAAQADIAEVQRAKIRKEVIDTETAYQFFSNIATPIRRIIELSPLSIAEKDRAFEQLESINLEAIIQATLEQDNDAQDTRETVLESVREA